MAFLFFYYYDTLFLTLLMICSIFMLALWIMYTLRGLDGILIYRLVTSRRGYNDVVCLLDDI